MRFWEVVVVVVGTVVGLFFAFLGFALLKSKFAPESAHILPDEPGWYVSDVHIGPEVGVYCLVKPEEIDTRPPLCWIGLREVPQ